MLAFRVQVTSLFTLGALVSEAKDPHFQNVLKNVISKYQSVHQHELLNAKGCVA